MFTGSAAFFISNCTDAAKAETEEKSELNPKRW
jgi:hypothetical protein